MNEKKARYISLIIISLGSIFVFFSLWSSIFPTIYSEGYAFRIEHPNILESVHTDVITIALLILFFIIGIGVISSVFSKTAFFILMIFEFIVSILSVFILFLLYAPLIYLILIFTILISPLVLYFCLQIRTKKRNLRPS